MTALRRHGFLRSAFAIAFSALTLLSSASAMDGNEIPEFPPPPRPTNTTPTPLLGLASQYRCAYGVANQIDKMQQGNTGSFNHLLGFRTGGKIYGWRYTKTDNDGPVYKVTSNVGGVPYWVYWPGGNNHFQSLARYANTAYGKFFVWSGADWHAGPEGGAHLFFATMDSRSEDLNYSMTGGAGGRPASNFQPDPQYGWSMPAPQDRIFHRMDLDNSTMHPDGSVTYWHAGGIQAHNGLLAVMGLRMAVSTSAAETVSIKGKSSLLTSIFPGSRLACHQHRTLFRQTARSVPSL